MEGGDEERSEAQAMGWVRDALRQLKVGHPATVRPTGGPLRGLIEGGQAVTISPVDPATVAVDDVVLVPWKGNPVLLVVKETSEEEVAVGDTLGPASFGRVPRSAVMGKVTEVHALPEGHVPKPKPRTIVFGLDTPRDYGPARVRSTLGVPSLASHGETAAEAAQVLFLPSFHSECCLTATLDDAAPRVTLVTMQTNLWYWWGDELRRARGNVGEDEQPPRSPERWQETAEIPRQRLVRFSTELAPAADPLRLSDTELLTIDGMRVHGEYRSRDGRTNAFLHHVHPDFPQHRAFVLALYRLAADLLRDERSVRTLENIHGYLAAGLPLKLLPGPPLTVRIFGRLSSPNERELRDALAQVPNDAPVLMDMSNFEGMGTLLYPVFLEFQRQRRARTVWWATGFGRRHVEAIGIPAASTFETRDEALGSLLR